MREIKFRAWNAGKKKWLMGYDYGSLGGFSMFGECMLLGEWSSVLDAFLFERDGRKQEHLKVMQFTGLKDKNGKEIYEGDVLKVADRISYEVRYVTEVEDDERVAGFALVNGHRIFLLDTFAINEGAVIGNIYENKDLLV